MAMLAYFRGVAGIRLFPWISLAGMAGSFAIGKVQARQVRLPVDRRFLGALAGILGFGLLWPVLLRPAVAGPQLVFAYIGLVVAQVYVVAGFWFDTYTLWLGLLLAVLIVVGFCWFLPIFWPWIAVCCGGTLLLTGCYVRYYWR